MERAREMLGNDRSPGLLNAAHAAGLGGVGVEPRERRGRASGQPGPTKSGSSSLGARIGATF